MKQLLITIAGVVLVGCGNPEADRALFTAVKVESIQAIEQAIAAGADVNAKEQRDPGWTPLHIATQLDHKEIAKLLIINDAYVNAKDNYGLTSLHWAARVGCKETAELLIEKGSDLNAKDDADWTPLNTAAYEGHKEIVELLIAKGADVNAGVSQQKSTPLHSAVAENHKEVAELLIANGADVDDGWTWEKVQSQLCFNNLKQIGTAIGIYAINNQDRYPWQVPQSEGGTAEIAQPRSDTDALLDIDGKPIFDANAWRHFQVLSDELSNPKVLRCPNDESQTQANTFSSTPPKRAGRNIIPFDKNSVSYWLRTDPEVDKAQRNEVMVVCPHHDEHKGLEYNILLTDSSARQTDWNGLARYFKKITKPITLAPQ